MQEVCSSQIVSRLTPNFSCRCIPKMDHVGLAHGIHTTDTDQYSTVLGRQTVYLTSRFHIFYVLLVFRQPLWLIWSTSFTSVLQSSGIIRTCQVSVQCVTHGPNQTNMSRTSGPRSSNLCTSSLSSLLIHSHYSCFRSYGSDRVGHSL